MAGIYIHIPFCKSRCVYCDFYSTTGVEWHQRYVDAVCREFQVRANYIKERVRTIYIGGGTPSQLAIPQLRQLLETLPTDDAEEVTLECNPDDVTDEFVSGLSLLPVNRVSMGAQSFSDERLRFLHRRHKAAQVAQAVERLRSIGIGNISVDLIYGFPDETLDDWHKDMEAAMKLQVEHLSAYALQYESGTLLGRWLEEGRIREVDEELSRRMYYDLIDRLYAAGYEHYEISNFARPGFRSRHNSGYWNQTPYLGLGAAAHSFDGCSRQWNVADIRQYMEGIETGNPCVEREELDADTRYNEMVMTALRTCDGLSLSSLSVEQRACCLSQAKPYLQAGLIENADDHIRLTREGLFVSDMVISDLMMV
ncbi:MAG: radical SAM family heme chaperone HemW [Prevotella sp.]|nr:radical SAM family heme chaperone HemW [Prevotella sp.]